MERSVILLTVDSWRADHCGFSGYGRDVTPALDDAARGGLVFENAIAPAATTSGSVPTFLTGHYPNPGLETDGGEYRDLCRTHLRTHRTLPQRFGDRGYETGAFTANPWTSRYYGYGRDFDFFEDFMSESATSSFVEEGPSRTLLGDSVLKMVNLWKKQDMLLSWEAYYDDLLEWIERADQPYFLWLFLVDAHMPYLPPARLRSVSKPKMYLGNVSLFFGQGDLPFRSVLHDPLVRAYDDAISHVDEFIGALLDDLEGIDEEPLIAVHGDHGEAFGENGAYGHGHGVSEDQLHVPLVVLNGPTDAVTRPFSLRRLPEFLSALATGEPIDPDEFAEPAVWARTYDPEVLVRGERWRYVWRPGDERIEVRTDGEWVDADRSELATLGRGVRRKALRSEAERRRVHESIDAVCETAEL